jgi:carbohydrate-binding DOMON domain-containing protein
MSAQAQHPHVVLLEELRREMAPVLDGSPQPMYVYLDNKDKICNQKFASMLGYGSPHDWESIPDPMVNVEDASVNNLVATYQKAVEKKIGSVVDITWKTNDGKTVASTVILVPFAFKGELMAIHYVTAR